MNKLDALIEECKDVAESTFNVMEPQIATTIRRILEAVREDYQCALAACEWSRSEDQCEPHPSRDQPCVHCPLSAAVTEALG